MNTRWEFSSSDVERVRSVVHSRIDLDRVFLTSRIRRNVSVPAPIPDEEEIWKVQLMCLMTSQQRSGPNSPVSQLLYQDPFPLSLAACRKADHLFAFGQDNLRRVRGIRFTNKLPQQMVDNLDYLDRRHGWSQLLAWRDRLAAARSNPPDPSVFELETKAAQYMRSTFEGFGPKQARNFWQSLGLTRYSFVLDSRVTRWLRENVDVPRGLLVAEGLGNEDYYLFISGMLGELCAQAGVLPCVFDAAVFDSFDSDNWDVDTPL